MMRPDSKIPTVYLCVEAVDFRKAIHSLGFEVDFSLHTLRVIQSLDRIFEWRGKPEAICCNDDPEYLGAQLVEWAA